MQITCPSCQAAVTLASSLPAEGLLTCEQCGHKFRLVVEMPASVTGLADLPEPPAQSVLRNEKQKLAGSNRPQGANGEFRVKAAWAAVVLLVLLALVYVAVQWWAR